jgi:hypothetical protein
MTAGYEKMCVVRSRAYSAAIIFDILPSILLSSRQAVR